MRLVIKSLAGDREFVSAVAGDELLLKLLARKSSLADQLTNRLRQSILNGAFAYDIADAVLEKRGDQFDRFVAKQCGELMEKERVAVRLDYLEQKIVQFNRELNGLVELAKSAFGQKTN